MNKIVQTVSMIMTQRFYLPVTKETIQEWKEPTMAKESQTMNLSQKSIYGRQKGSKHYCSKRGKSQKPKHLDVGSFYYYFLLFLEFYFKYVCACKDCKLNHFKLFSISPLKTFNFCWIICNQNIFSIYNLKFVINV